MIDYYIFGFGLVVTLLVGSGLTTMIIAHNRAIEAEERESEAQEDGKPAPVAVRVSERD